MQNRTENKIKRTEQNNPKCFLIKMEHNSKHAKKEGKSQKKESNLCEKNEKLAAEQEKRK